MNRGTAIKWLDCIKTTSFDFGNGQLRYENYCDPLGVLAHFLDPNGWQDDYIGMSWHGEKFKLPAFALKQCKIKTPFLEFETDNGRKVSLVDIIDGSVDWYMPIYYIERYWEKF